MSPNDTSPLMYQTDPDHLRDENKLLWAVVTALRNYVADNSDENCDRLIKAEAELSQTCHRVYDTTYSWHWQHTAECLKG
jgi:hypothetical protein